MGKTVIKQIILAASALVFVACGSSSSTPSSIVEDVEDSTKSILTEDLKDSITYMYNEEGLAYDVYMHIYNYQVANNLPTVNQLQKIATNSEIKHIEAVNELAIKYDLNMTTYDPTLEPYSKEDIGDGKYSVQHIQDLYDILYPKGIKSKQDALEVGCMVEVVDIDDLNIYIDQAKQANASDVLDVFTFLITGSYAHYWSFSDGLENMGVAGGCCSLEPALGYDFCHDESEYPRK